MCNLVREIDKDFLRYIQAKSAETQGIEELARGCFERRSRGEALGQIDSIRPSGSHKQIFQIISYLLRSNKFGVIGADPDFFNRLAGNLYHFSGERREEASRDPEWGKNHLFDEDLREQFDLAVFYEFLSEEGRGLFHKSINSCMQIDHPEAFWDNETKFNHIYTTSGKRPVSIETARIAAMCICSEYQEEFRKCFDLPKEVLREFHHYLKELVGGDRSFSQCLEEILPIFPKVFHSFVELKSAKEDVYESTGGAAGGGGRRDAPSTAAKAIKQEIEDVAVGAKERVLQGTVCSGIDAKDIRVEVYISHLFEYYGARFSIGPIQAVELLPEWGSLDPMDGIGVIIRMDPLEGGRGSSRELEYKRSLIEKGLQLYHFGKELRAISSDALSDDEGRSKVARALLILCRMSDETDRSEWRIHSDIDLEKSIPLVTAPTIQEMILNIHEKILPASKWFEGLFTVVDRAVRSGQNILFQSSEGKAQSSIAIICYMMKTFDVSYEHAVAFLKAHADCIDLQAEVAALLEFWSTHRNT